MSKQLLLLARISRSEYNKTLYNDYKMYMNSQMAFRNKKFTHGQYDEYEGAVSNIPSRVLYSADNKKTWHELKSEIKITYKDNYAYIYCMYGIAFDERNYDRKTNKFYHLIPWEYIEPLWQGEDTELLIIKNTSILIGKFHRAAEREHLSHAYGAIHYDLEEKLNDIKYLDKAMRDSFESVYHKPKSGYELQNEVRFSIICPMHSDHYELELFNDNKLQFTLVPLKEGKSILVELQNIEFENGVPVRFSSEINYYES